jgi:hypothetical protein
VPTGCSANQGIQQGPGFQKPTCRLGFSRSLGPIHMHSLAQHSLYEAAGASVNPVMQLQLLACTVGVLLWAALPTAMASAADLLKAGDAAYSSGNYNRSVTCCDVHTALYRIWGALRTSACCKSLCVLDSRADAGSAFRLFNSWHVPGHAVTPAVQPASVCAGRQVAESRNSSCKRCLPLLSVPHGSCFPVQTGNACALDIA